jgi:hypothetical protein
MTNLTITVDDEVLRRARIRALEEGSSVNAVLRDNHARYVDDRDRADRDRSVLRRAMDHAQAHPGASGGQRLRRDDLYEERTRWPR